MGAVIGGAMHAGDTNGAAGILKRYTSLPVAIDMLVSGRLTLLNPSHWQDRNDVAFMEGYRAASGAGAILAACFTQAPETYHHWGVFAAGHDGVRIDIDKGSLLASLARAADYLWGDVTYLTLREIGERVIHAPDLPFLKRHAFRDEREFRLLYRCDDPATGLHHVPIDRAWIRGIALSPWLPDNLIDPVKSALRLLPGCGHIRLLRTNLRDHAQWKAAIDRART